MGEEGGERERGIEEEGKRKAGRGRSKEGKGEKERERETWKNGSVRQGDCPQV